ncbi:MAG: hypothetical protein RXO24_02915 [Acidilobus sp.]
MTTRPYTFARHGARRFIALGPLPNAASCAEENVDISGLGERVKIANAILGKSGYLRCRVTTVLMPQ